MNQKDQLLLQTFPCLIQGEEIFKPSIRGKGGQEIHTIEKGAFEFERWLRKSGQRDKWIVCLKPARMVVIRRDDGQETRAEPQPAFKAKVALAAVRGEKTLTELAQQFDVRELQDMLGEQ